MRQKKAGVLQTVITANVAEDGQVRLTGTIQRCSQSNYQVEYKTIARQDPKVVAIMLSGSQKASRHLSFQREIPGELVARLWEICPVLYYLLEHGSDEIYQKLSSRSPLQTMLLDSRDEPTQG